jgi:hypothetical protein
MSLREAPRLTSAYAHLPQTAEHSLRTQRIPSDKLFRGCGKIRSLRERDPQPVGTIRRLRENRKPEGNPQPAGTDPQPEGTDPPYSSIINGSLAHTC